MMTKNENDWNYVDYKRLEELFSWAYFYKVNRLDKQYAHCQLQIEEQRKKLKFI